MTTAKDRQPILNQWLKPHQRDFLQAAKTHEKFGCCITIGGGKTFSALCWLNQLFAKNKVKSAIVLCPASKVSDWARDLQGHLGTNDHAYPAFNVVKIKSGKDLSKLTAPEEEAVYLISAGLFQQQATNDFIKNNGGVLRQFAYIFDESSKLKNTKSVISQNITLLNFYVPYGLLLSGSLMSNGYVDLFLQAFLLGVNFKLDSDLDVTYTDLRDYYGNYWRGWHLFESNYLVKSLRQIKLRNNSGVIKDRVIEEITGYKNDEILLKKLKQKIFIVDENYVTQTSETHFVTEKADFTVYEDVVKLDYAPAFGTKSYYGDLQRFLAHYKIPDFGLDLSRLSRQWASGYMTFNENHRRLFNVPFSEVYNKVNVKIDWLKTYLRANGFVNAIIFYNFNYELNDLRQMAADLGYTAIEINGQHKFQGLAYQEKQLILAQYAAGSIGLNLQHLAHHLIFYSPAVSCEQYLQAKGRIDRTGQTEDCYIVDLLIKHSVEERIFKALLSRQDYVEKTFNLKKVMAEDFNEGVAEKAKQTL